MVSLKLSAALFEEVAEQFCRLGLQESVFGLEVVVEPGIFGEIVESTGESGLRICRGVDEAGDTGGVGGPGAHGARFEGRVECATGEAPASQTFGGFSEGQEFGVGGRILGCFAFVGGDGEDLIATRYDGSDGHLSPLRSLFGKFEGASHHGQVALSVGLYGLKVSGHAADNNSDGLA